MAVDIAFASGNAVTVSTTELSLVSGTTTSVPLSNTNVGLYSVTLDCNNMAKGDEFRLKVYEKACSGGTQRLLFDAYIADAQVSLFTTPGVPLGNGWDITLTKTAGTDRAFDWSVRRVY